MSANCQCRQCMSICCMPSAKPVKFVEVGCVEVWTCQSRCWTCQSSRSSWSLTTCQLMSGSALSNFYASICCVDLSYFPSWFNLFWIECFCVSFSIFMTLCIFLDFPLVSIWYENSLGPLSLMRNPWTYISHPLNYKIKYYCKYITILT